MQTAFATIESMPRLEDPMLLYCSITLCTPLYVTSSCESAQHSVLCAECLAERQHWLAVVQAAGAADRCASTAQPRRLCECRQCPVTQLIQDCDVGNVRKWCMSVWFSLVPDKGPKAVLLDAHCSADQCHILSSS